MLGWVSLGIGLANMVFARDPRSFDRALPSGTGKPGLGGWAAAKAALADVRSVLVVPTFAIIITQVRGVAYDSSVGRPVQVTWSGAQLARCMVREHRL